MSESAITEVWTPPLGGLASTRVHYPGQINRAERHYELVDGDCRVLRLSAGTVLKLSASGGGAGANASCPVRLVVLNDHNRFTAEALGIDDSGLTPLVRDGFFQEPLVSRLHARGLCVDTAKMFSARVGQRPWVLEASQNLTLFVIVPGAANSLVDGTAREGITIDIKAPSAVDQVLPEPLGRIKDEFRVQRSSALAYELAEGEFVQVIDVEGRQCSDFVAFNAAELDNGNERFTDTAVTRSMVRGAYPIPGLFDKFFDQDMQPLMAVVQDTVGRHDTFALACTARGYEERGFPGHVNCSDNISDACIPYSIRRRDAWPAINFFFNSWIDPADNLIQVDEAWSRPGDYVLMRALRDLVCVSTACPDDVDPINGWNPTDIHVRIYHADAAPRRAIAYRPKESDDAIMTQESALHPRTSKLTQSFSIARDVWAPVRFDATGFIAEYWACREALTIQDMSSLRKLDIAGPDAEQLLQKALTKDVSKLSVNRGFYALICDERGSVMDDGTLFRLAPDVFRWCCGSDESAIQLRELAESMGARAWIRDLSSQLANLAVQGPKSRAVLNALLFTQPGQPRFEAIKWFGFVIARLHDRDGAPLMVTRSGYTGELGYEIFCDSNDALVVWDAVMAAGESSGIKPMGLEALNVMRVEAGLMAAGAEFGPGTDPDDAGLGFAINMNKPSFTGREAIERNRKARRQKLVGLVLEGEEVPVHGDGVYEGRHQVGVVTSAVRSPQLAQVIAMARVAVECADEGGELEIGKLDHHSKRLPCRVTGIPFIDPGRVKPRA